MAKRSKKASKNVLADIQANLAANKDDSGLYKYKVISELSRAVKDGRLDSKSRETVEALILDEDNSPKILRDTLAGSDIVVSEAAIRQYRRRFGSGG